MMSETQAGGSTDNTDSDSESPTQLTSPGMHSQEQPISATLTEDRVPEDIPGPARKPAGPRTRQGTAKRRRLAGSVKPTRRKWPPGRDQSVVREGRPGCVVTLPRPESPRGGPDHELQRLRRTRDLTAHGIIPKHSQGIPRVPTITLQSREAAQSNAVARADVSHRAAAETLAHFANTEPGERAINPMPLRPEELEAKTPTEKQCRESEDLGKQVYVAGWNINCSHFIRQSWQTIPQFPHGYHEDYQFPQGRPEAYQHPNAFARPSQSEPTRPFKSLLTGEPFGPRSFHVIDNSRMPSAAHECHPHLTLDEIQTPLATTSQSSCSGTDSAIVPTAGTQSASMQEDQSNCQPMKQLTSSTHKNFED